MKAGRVLVFGIDGATFDVIFPAMDKGKLPHLRSLIEGGVSGRMQSSIHPVTPMAWTNFATGANAGKHGIFDFTRVSKNQIRLNSSRDRKMPAIWTHLSQAGRDCVVVNVPFTCPPEEIRGVMIPGFDAPRISRDIFHPESVYDELVQAFGRYQLDWTFPVGKSMDVKRYLDHVKRTIAHRGETSLYLLEKHPWDFYMTMFSSPDHVQHVFWKHPGGREIIETIYGYVDECLGQFLDAVPDDVTVMVMSDHGFGPISSIVYLDNWLEREGFLKRHHRSLRRSALRQCKRWIKRALPTSSRKFLRSKLPGLKARVDTLEHTASIDWERTRAYSYGMYGNVFINLKGRNPRGIVEPADYESLCDDVSARLRELEDPKTAERVVEHVYRKEELYSGPLVGDAPDLVVRWRDYAYFTKGGIDRGKEVFSDDLKVDASDYPHTGTHRLDGVFICKGPRICRRKQISLNIVDLAPTILHIMGEPIPPDMDGKLLRDVFETAPGAAGPVAGRGQSVAESQSGRMKEPVELREQDQQAVFERLRSLGYIE